MKYFKSKMDYLAINLYYVKKSCGSTSIFGLNHFLYLLKTDYLTQLASL